MTLRRKAHLASCCFLLTLWSASALAQNVRPPSATQVAAAKTMFKRGLVVMVEQTKAGDLDQVTLFGRINVPQKVLYDVLADPATLSQQQPGMRNVEVKAQRGNAVTYSWTYGDVLTKINGTWASALAPPQAVAVRSVSGFGPGVMLYRLFPDGEDQTTMSVTINVDVTKSSNAIFRWLTNANPDFKQAWNLGYAIVLYRGVELVAVKRAGAAGLPTPTGDSGSGPLRPFTPAQVGSLRPLLEKGTVAVIESDAQGRIAQASLVERVEAPPAAVQKALDDPAQWSRFIKSVEVDGAQRTAEGHAFKLGFSFTAFTIRTDIAMKMRPDGADLVSPSGDLSRSLISYTYAADGNGTVLTSSGRVRFRQGGRMLRSMIDNDPYFGHALNASSMVVLTHAFKLRAEGQR